MIDPVAIVEAAGTVLVLDRPPAGPSAIVLADPLAPGRCACAPRLAVQVEALDPTRPDLPAFLYDVVGQDLCAGGPADELPLPARSSMSPMQPLAAREAFALLDRPRGDGPARAPARRAADPRLGRLKAIVASGGDVYYDAVGRSIRLEPFGICNMERTATLRTPVAFSDHPIPGQPFDSGIPHCVWHRLLLDVDVPSGCSISIAARASDDAGLLDRLRVHRPTAAVPARRRL